MNLTEPSDRDRFQTVCLAVIAVILITFSIYWLRPVLVPLVVALFVVSGITPLLQALEESLHVNRLVAAAITFVVGLIIVVIFSSSIWYSVKDLSDNAQPYRDRIEEIVNQLESTVDELIPSSMVAGSKVESSTTRSEKADPSDFVDELVREGISRLTHTMFNLVSNSIIVLIYVFFLLLGTSGLGRSGSLATEIDQQVRSYLSMKTVVSILTGSAFGLTLFLFGVPMSLTFGVLAFLLNFVPNIGPIVASLLPVPLILLDPNQSIGWMIGVILATGSIQLISGNLLEPKVLGSSSDLHPVTILVALMFWGMLWGIIGMFLATPITAAIRILLQRIDQTRPIAEWMAGRSSGLAS
ncbi:MAG: AI-2E family transporter [Planctomycetota bacterium]